MLADAARRQIHDLAQCFLDSRFIDLARAMQVNIDRKWLGNTDGVGKLDRAAISKIGGNDILGEVARCIGGRAVNLGRVLAGECATAMRSGTTVGIDDDLATRQTRITIGPANDELARWIDVPVAVCCNWKIAERITNVRLNNRTDLLESQLASRCCVERTIWVTSAALPFS